MKAKFKHANMAVAVAMACAAALVNAPSSA